MVIYVKLKKTTKSLGVIIDNKLNYRNHSTKTIERAKRNLKKLSSRYANEKGALQFKR